LLHSSIKPIWKNFFNLGVFQAAGMLLQLLVIPIINKNYGLATFGEVALASSVGLFLANLVNYGTNQTAIKDVSIHRNDKEKLSFIFSEIFWLRIVVFITITTTTTIITITTKNEYLLLWFSILPLVASEIFNPLYFLIGIEKIQWISWGNIITRATSLGLILLFPLHQYIAPSLNLLLSLPLLVYYLLLSFYVVKKFELHLSLTRWADLRKKVLENFYVTFNGSSVILQQSIFMFAVAGTSSPQTLGAYGIIDKLLGAVRQLVSSFSSAIYPRAAQLFQEGISHWNNFRSKVQKGYTLVFLTVALLLFFFAEFGSVVFTRYENPTTVLFFRYFSLAPLALALNANNVLDMLLSKSYKQMFYISILIIIATFLISSLLTRFFNESSIGFYPLIIESTCLLIYTIFLRTKTTHPIA
jgi:O-antigen/teichoic acid export membrane protein